MTVKKISKQVKLDGAQMLVAALTASTLGFLKERGIAISDWVAYVGDVFEGSWAAFEGRGGDDILDHVAAFNAAPMGAEVISLTQEGDAWELVVSSIPSEDVLARFGTAPEEFLEGFGITRDEFAMVYSMFEAPAAAIGHKFTHSRKGRWHVLRLEPAKKAGRTGRRKATPKATQKPKPVAEAGRRTK